MSAFTQHDALLYLLRRGPITTNEILASPYGLAAEYRARIAELRGMGYGITCEIHRGGASVWRLESEPGTTDLTSDSLRR